MCFILRIRLRSFTLHYYSPSLLVSLSQLLLPAPLLAGLPSSSASVSSRPSPLFILPSITGRGCWPSEIRLREGASGTRQGTLGQDPWPPGQPRAGAYCTLPQVWRLYKPATSTGVDCVTSTPAEEKVTRVLHPPLFSIKLPGG